MSAAPLAIDVHGLTKRFGPRTVVDNVDIAIPRGEVWGFLGPNGSGKTTTIRMLCGLLLPDAGTGTCLGFDIINESAQIKARTGYMTQRFSYYEDLSIRENLEFVARVYGMTRRREAVDRAIEGLGLTSRQKQLAGTLSGGWKQRLALAASVLHEPELLLLDEPTAGVDPEARREFWENIHKLAHQGITILVSTHYMDEAERCDHIVYIAYGTMLARGTVPELIAGAGLVTFEATPRAGGDSVRSLEARLSGKPGVDLVAVFGQRLHVSGQDRALLARAIAAEHGFEWREAETSLEDVFINLVKPFREKVT
ncbi:MAG TPA: ABC transporter ATP-binding protein [Micropepsaceae bacterium]|nr:ABC transporter ATP-binding protein [Micropepsaceae bacterium]